MPIPSPRWYLQRAKTHTARDSFDARSHMLTSLANPTVRHLVRMRDNRSRRREKRVIVDGWRETLRALESGLVPMGLYTTETEASSEEHQSVIAAAAGYLREVSPAVMEKIGYGQSPRGVVAEFEAPQRELEQLVVPSDPLILVLDQLEKPGNIGAAFRTADAAGIDAVLLTPADADRFNPNAIRSSLGTVFSVPSAVADEAEARCWLAERNIEVFAARVEASRLFWDADFQGPSAIVIGSEATGLRDHWGSRGDSPVSGVRLPMSGKADSLNASVSAAVLLFEARRQRNVMNRS